MNFFVVACQLVLPGSDLFYAITFFFCLSARFARKLGLYFFGGGGGGGWSTENDSPLPPSLPSAKKKFNVTTFDNYDTISISQLDLIT